MANSNYQYRNNQPWCPTAVDEWGNYEYNSVEGAEGHCGGQNCSFPIGKTNYNKQKLFCKECKMLPCTNHDYF